MKRNAKAKDQAAFIEQLTGDCRYRAKRSPRIVPPKKFPWPEPGGPRRELEEKCKTQTTQVRAGWFSEALIVAGVSPDKLKQMAGDK